jgi:hypothetical protein
MKNIALNKIMNLTSLAPFYITKTAQSYLLIKNLYFCILNFNNE